MIMNMDNKVEGRVSSLLSEVSRLYMSSNTSFSLKIFLCFSILSSLLPRSQGMFLKHLFIK